MSKADDKLKSIQAKLDAFLSLPQEDRVNIIQAVVIDKITDEEVSAKDVSSLTRAYIESTGLKREDRLGFSNISPDDIRGEEETTTDKQDGKED